MTAIGMRKKSLSIRSVLTGSVWFLASCQASFNGISPSGLLNMSVKSRAQGKSTSSQVILIGEGQSAMNSGNIAVNGMGNEIFEYTKDDHPIPTNLNVCFYGMAALEADPQNSKKMATADYATLINSGTIELWYHDFVEKFKNDTKLANTDRKLYDNMMGWGILAGDNSTVINNGTINMYYDENDYGYSIFSHPMYAGSNSTIINNGMVNITGNGSTGAQIRGLTSSHSNMLIENNGLIHINIGKAYMARALASTGTNNILKNNGKIDVNTSSIVYGMSQNGGSYLENNGIVEVVTKGYTPQDMAPGIFPVFTAGAYGIGDNGSAVSEGFYKNNGIIKARVEGDAASDPYACAHGMLFLGNKAGLPARQISNLGIIEVSSSTLPSEANGYINLASEVGINTLHSGVENDKALTVKVGKWATTLRDFSQTKDLFIGRNGTFDFTDTELIFRPADDYKAGTQYDVSQKALVHDVKMAKTNSNELNVVGFESIKYSTEMPELLTVNVTENQMASLELADDKESVESMISNAVMSNIDLARNMITVTENEIGKSSGLFAVPFAGHTGRDNGLNGSIYGLLLGSSWKLADGAWRIGVHGSYGHMEGDGDFYQAESVINGWQIGVHSSYNFTESLYFKSTLTGFLNGGDNHYSVNHTGVDLSGTSKNDMRGLYASLTTGNKFGIGETSQLCVELGASSFNMYNLPEVNWTLHGEPINGYRMNFQDKYRSVYMNGMMAWNNRTVIGESVHTFSVGGGVRGKLFADKIRMGMIGSLFKHTLSEDNVLGLVRLSYAWTRGRYHLGCEYSGDFGSRTIYNVFALSLNLVF